MCFCCCLSQVLTIKLKVQLVAFSCILFIYSFYFACFNLIVLCLSCCGLFRPGARLIIERLALCVRSPLVYLFTTFSNFYLPTIHSILHLSHCPSVRTVALLSWPCMSGGSSSFTSVFLLFLCFPPCRATSSFVDLSVFASSSVCCH